MAGVKQVKKTAEETTNKTRRSVKDKADSVEPENDSKKKTVTKATRKTPTKATKAVTPEVEETSTKKAAGRPKSTVKTNGTPASSKSTPAKAAGSAKKSAATATKATATETDQKTEAEPPRASRKRKASEEPAPAPAKRTKTATKGPVINKAPTQKLNVYVFGEGTSGELGLGPAKKCTDVKRPRLNANLTANDVGVVQIVAGGMHVVALTHDNKILTWGVNDQGALGRDTTWDGGLKDMDENNSDDEDDEDENSGMNPNECVPKAIPSDKFPSTTVFVQVAAGDSMTFALTDDGQVWGWGTFRSNEGIFGFTATSLVQQEPMLIPTLKKIKKISCGANHVLALDANGSVFAWGSGQQNQLGRRVIERTKTQGLIPREFGLPKKLITDIECGAYHSFALDSRDRVWAWGLNNYGETGIPDSAGEDEAVVLRPQVVESLAGKRIQQIKGGSHHSIAVTDDGECLTWGRVDGCQIGIEPSELDPESVIKNDRGTICILKVPTKVTAIKEAVTSVSAQSDHCIAITENGKAYSWGFSANYQTGQGTDEDVPIATLVDNNAVRDKKLNGAYAGGQFGILTSPADTTIQSNGEGDVKMVNGTS